MPREPEPSLNAATFLRSALRSGQRLTPRPLLSHRALDLSFDPTPGTVTLSLGRTRILVKISSSITTPFPDRKFDGVFTISTELSPLASPAFEVGRQQDAETLLSRLLEKTIRRSGALDTESLCIVAGEKVFAVRADVHVLDFDGGLVDAACAAVVAGLLHYRRPEVEVRGEEVKIFDPREREPVRLSLNHVPFCVTFSFFRNVPEEVVGKGGTGYVGDGEEVVVVDADLLEEQVRDAELVVGMNRFGEVVQLAKYGGYPIKPLKIIECTKVAEEKAKWLHKVVMEKLDEDEKTRNKDGLMAELRADNERDIPG
ncbi:ribosomal protein S5 domain 2-type protein [Elsinoe ampelina]|uniref:Ribosomal protein S5 domain 2-type protein n=1 Tax=Elsinoe ampelina TaxID=302913 RepID=A0A6A6FZJ3_9PEZI|nr:ribosomal protein S5 domain 2-type protein [Elsinoe ampelina]